jgi:uncharacterized protein (TIGR03435 family)
MSTPAAAKASGYSQSLKHDYRFEVASVRPATPPDGHEYLNGPQGYTPGRFRRTNVSLAVLAFMAFGLKHKYETRYPSWMDSTYFSVNATLPEGATKADLPIMIRHLLEDRFGLVSHDEMREMAGYELFVAKFSPRLVKSAGTPDISVTKGSGVEMKNRVAQLAKDAPSGQLFSGSTVIWRGRDRTMKKLAEDLADQLGEPVMDATGLDGEYDYTFTYTNETNSATSEGPTEDPTHTIMLDAMQEQIGLKLRPVKNVLVDVVVLDSVKKEPTQN